MIFRHKKRRSCGNSNLRAQNRIHANLILLALAAAATFSGAEARNRPNILFLFTDDQRHDTIAALGNRQIKTPAIDRIVKSGVSFLNAYIMGGSSPAVCSPSRACLFSGRTLWNLESQGEYSFEISGKFPTLPQVFRENGYVTFATGKNEPGRGGHFARSFSTGEHILFRGMTKSQYELPLCPFSPTGDYSAKNEVMHKGTHSAELYADACIRFIKSRTKEKEPFFAYVAFQTPHDPRQCPPEFRQAYRDEDIELPKSFLPKHPFDNGMLGIRDEKLAPFPRTPEIVKKHIADYYATITHTDAQIGRILDTLDQLGLAENTIVVFSSDNGLALGRHGLMGKQNIYDHSVHLPLIVSGPGIPRGERRNQLCYIYDIFPTLCERAEIPVPATVQFQSLNNAITHADAKLRDHLYFAFMSWQRAIRDERYKLIEYCVEGARHTQLFDLVNDPDEIRDLSGEEPSISIVERLRKKLKEDKASLHDGDTGSTFTDKLGKDFWAAFENSTPSGKR